MKTAIAITPSRSRRVIRWSGYLFVLLYCVFMLAFGLGPGLYAFAISFAKFVEGRPQWFQAGINNYITAYTDFRFAGVFTNVGRFLLISLPLGVVGVVGLALLLHMRADAASAALRTLYFVPGAVAGPPAVLLAIFMFDPNLSPFAPLLRGLGFQVVGDVITPESLPLICTLLGFFVGAGGWIAIFYGGLNGISSEVIEAATIDGCTPWQIARYIKLPLIQPYIIYMVILTFAGNVQLFAEPQLIGASQVAPIPQQWSPNQLGYEFAFGLGNFGASAAISLLMLLIGLFGAVLVLRGTSLFRVEASEHP